MESEGGTSTAPRGWVMGAGRVGADWATCAVFSMAAEGLGAGWFEDPTAAALEDSSVDAGGAGELGTVLVDGVGV